MKAIKISKVFIEPVNVPLEEPFRIAIGTKYSIENALVTVVLDNGIEGYGEAAPLEPINGENQATVLATLNSCVDFIKGKEITDYRAVSATLRGVFWAQITARPPARTQASSLTPIVGSCFKALRPSTTSGAASPFQERVR